MTTIAQTLAPFTATATFMFTNRNDKLRYDGQLCADVYCSATSYAWDANPFTALEAAGIDYKAMNPMIVVKGGGKQLTERHVFGKDTDIPFARVQGEHIFAWLDRVMVMPQVRGVSVVIPADRLTKEQVQYLFDNLGAPKYQAETTAKLVSMFRTPTPDTPAELVARQKFAAPVKVDPSAAIDHANVADDKPVIKKPAAQKPVKPIAGQPVEPVEPIALTSKDYKALYMENLGIKAPNIKVHHLALLYTALMAEKAANV
jgi:hypothetical protein